MCSSDLDAQTYADLDIEIATNLAPLWDYSNRAKHPIRKDNVLTVAPLYTRREFVSNQSPIFFPQDLPDPMNKPSGTRTWYHAEAYQEIYTYAAAPGDSAVAMPLIYDGGIVDAMLAEGHGYGTPTLADEQTGSFDFKNFRYDTGVPACTQIESGRLSTNERDRKSTRLNSSH